MTEPEHTKEPSEIISEESDKESDEEQEAVITIEKTDESEPSEPEENGEKGDTEGFVLPAIVSEEEAQENGYVARDKDSEENLYTFVFRNADGTGTMRLYSHPVKYVDSEGETRDITLDVKEDGNGGYVSADHYVVTQFPNDFTEGIELGYEDTDLHITAEITGENVFAEKTGGSVTYSADENTDYVYTLTYEGIKEDIIVSEYTGQTDYSFILDTAGLAVSENDGSYYLMDDKNEVKAAIGDIIVYSADDSNNTTGEIICDEITPNEQYRITLHVDDEYLRDEATVYPIRIDPTINVNYTNNGDGGIRDVTVYSNNTFNGTGSDLYVGRKNGLKARTLMKFPGLSLTNIHSSLNVTSATVEMIDCRHQEESVRVYCFMYGGGTWSENSASWSSTAEDYRLLQLDSVIVHNTTTHKFNFDISGAVKCWVDGSVSKDLGILFKTSDTVESGTNDKFKEFASYNRFTLKPSLTVVYTNEIVQNQYYSKYDYTKYYLNDNYVFPLDITDEVRFRMNCYGYAFDFMLGVPVSISPDLHIHTAVEFSDYGYRQQPGEFASVYNKQNNIMNIYGSSASDATSRIYNNMIYDAQRLGYTITQVPITFSSVPQRGINSRLVALVTKQDGRGYHFYMQHNDGTWSHKDGGKNISNKPLNSNQSTSIVLTNDNIISQALKGIYVNGQVTLYEITKSSIVDFAHNKRCCDDFYTNNPQNQCNHTKLVSFAGFIKGGEYFETACSKTVGHNSGLIDFNKDQDVFYFTPSSTKTYNINISTPYESEATVFYDDHPNQDEEIPEKSLKCKVYNSNGVLIASDDDGGNVLINIALTSGQKYYIILYTHDTTVMTPKRYNFVLS